jgi:hypothetical protein
MPLKDRFRRAIKRSDRESSSTSSSESNTPIPSLPQSGSATPVPADPNYPPTITLTKTNTSSRLSKTLTWGRSSRLTPEEKERKRIEEWQKKDAEAWDMPPSRRHTKHKSKAHQDILRSFELRFRDVRASFEGRRPSSTFSGISPGQSRVNSVDNGCPSFAGRNRGSGATIGMGPLSREVSRDDILPMQGVSMVVEE